MTKGKLIASCFAILMLIAAPISALASYSMTGGIVVNRSQAKAYSNITMSLSAPAVDQAIGSTKIYEEGDLRDTDNFDCSSNCSSEAVDNSVTFDCEYCGDGSASFYYNSSYVGPGSWGQTCDFP